MNNNVNVINNAGSNVDVKVNQVDGIIQIVIDVSSAGTELNTLTPGDVFKKNGIEYIVCEQFEDETTAVIRKGCLGDGMNFGNNNDWRESNIRKYLNDKYLVAIKDNFGAENIIEHEVDLTSLDGYDDYGISVDKVSVMNIDRYRKYHKYIGDTGKANYLSTPDSIPSGIGSSDVLCARGGGHVFCSGCSSDRGVRPFFILKSSISVSLD